MIALRRCTAEDAADLARMNRVLIEDEGADNPMDLHQLEERMQGFLKTRYVAYYFLLEKEVAGYALIDLQQSPLYLRHFMIERTQRRKGYGREAMAALLKELEVSELTLDVLPDNERAIAFYGSIGFRATDLRMRFTRGKQ